MGIVALIFVLVLAGVIVYYIGRAPGSLPFGTERAIVWQTNVASLEAGSLLIRAGELAFAGQDARFSVRSDDGNATSRTLEVQWLEQGREMRLNVYFEADASHWWVREISTYDGQLRADWISYRGPLLRTERGQSFEGRLELSSSEGRVPGRLTIENLRLTAFRPGTGPRPFEGCRMIGAINKGEQPDPLEAGQPLAGRDILGKSTSQVHDMLSGMGICHDFRLSWMFEGMDGRGFSQRWCVPPPGEVEAIAYGYEGHVIVFVSDPAPRTFDPNPSQSVACS